MNSKQTLIIGIALVVLVATFALAVASCGASAAQPTTPSAPATTAPAAQATTAPAVKPPAAPQTIEVKYTYDGAGRLTQAEYSNGVVIKYTYDKAGNLLLQEIKK